MTSQTSTQNETTLTMTCPECAGDKRVFVSLPLPAQHTEAREAIETRKAALGEALKATHRPLITPEEAAARLAEYNLLVTQWYPALDEMQAVLTAYPDPSRYEPCTQCKGIGTVSIAVNPNAALNYLLGRVIELERAASDGNPYTYQAYYDGLGNLPKGETE